MTESNKTIETKEKLPNMMTSFVNGAKKGTNLVIQAVIPNVVFALAFMKFLTLCGIIDIIGKVFSPIMGIFGLPGEAAMPLVLSFVSFSGGITSSAALALEGILTGDQVLMMLPFTLLVGSSIAVYTGRILGVTGIKSKHYKICYLTTVLTGILSLFVMRLVLSFM